MAAVIPTLRRPALLRRALESVFAQTLPVDEAIVVVDGPDEETVSMLRGIDDSRLVVVCNETSLTAAGARNLGVARASSAWIAFLDDDDEWLPTKLEKQMAVAITRNAAFVTCLSNVVTPIATYVWPRVIYDGVRPIEDYLFDRRSAFAGQSFIQTSSYLIRRSVFEQVRFQVHVPHDDWDFLIHLGNRLKARAETVPEALVNVYAEQERPSLSSGAPWQESLRWLDEIAPLMSRRAYSGFCLGVVGPRAARGGAWPAFLPLLVRAFRRGSPGFWHLAAYAAFWLVPIGLRRRLRPGGRRRP